MNPLSNPYLNAFLAEGSGPGQPSFQAAAQGPGHCHEVDLLEIYHARQLKDSIISQLKRLRASRDDISLDGRVRRQAITGYYKALLLTTAELLQELGDEIEPHRG